MEKDWMKYSWDDFFEKTKEKDIVIWGCGQIASEVIYLLERRRNIVHLVDGDVSKIGMNFEGRKIESPSRLFSAYMQLISNGYCRKAWKIWRARIFFCVFHDEERPAK